MTTTKATDNPLDQSSVQTQLEAIVDDPAQPVVLFALQSCQYCWSARKFFRQLDIPYRPIELDAAAGQDNSMSRAMRDALEIKLGTRQVPQIFVGGTCVGGCTDLFKAYQDGSLQQLLEAHDVSYNQAVRLDTDALLPRAMMIP